MCTQLWFSPGTLVQKKKVHVRLIGDSKVRLGVWLYVIYWPPVRVYSCLLSKKS